MCYWSCQEFFVDFSFCLGWLQSSIARLTRRKYCQIATTVPSLFSLLTVGRIRHDDKGDCVMGMQLISKNASWLCERMAWSTGASSRFLPCLMFLRLLSGVLSRMLNPVSGSFHDRSWMRSCFFSPFDFVKIFGIRNILFEMVYDL